MGSRKQDQTQRALQPSGLAATREEVEQAFRTMVKAIRCPACDLAYTDFAIEWGDAWSEGRRDLMRERGHLEGERDGPFKLKCELCGQKAWLNYFAGTVTSATEPEVPTDWPGE